MPRCLYEASFRDFLTTKPKEVHGTLISNYHGEVLTTTIEAWEAEISILQQVLVPWKEEEAQIIFEYEIPRIGKRIDVVLLLRGIIFCLEFKVGQKAALQADVEQVMDYALDLKNFHHLSHERVIVPILIPTEHVSSTTEFQPSVYDDQIYNPLISGAKHFQSLIEDVLNHAGATSGGTIDNWINKWIISPYTPTPTIIEAARALYESHSVENITRHEADKVYTDRTINYILQIIEQSKEQKGKSICFVTGVPGAGKTLVGLDVAIKQTELDKKNGAVYLSGNGPLVAVLTEALARDNQKKCSRVKGKQKKISDSRREVSEFIQIIHRYRDNMLAKIKNPVENGIVEIDEDKSVSLKETGHGEVEHVVIFDEAQRSWTHKHMAHYLKQGGRYGNKLKVPNFPMSEAEFHIWSLDQREDWAVIVCLVGGGQEINTGEAGITEWIKALTTKFTHWNVYISDKLTDIEYADGRVNELLENHKYYKEKVTYAGNLHLAVSLRSFRAETLSAFVQSMLTFRKDAASLYKDVASRNYPIMLTRDIDTARTWLRKQARGTQQTGILITKKAARFKPLAVHKIEDGDDNAVHWFLEDKTDIRSSNYLEVAATEIQVQGLELDYVCVLWDADMRCNKDKAWSYYKFDGKTKWSPENNEENQKYMLNAYRVLLTRARQGIIICIPEGNSRLTPEGFPEDPTRLPEYYDGTYEYLKSLGIKEI